MIKKRIKEIKRIRRTHLTSMVTTGQAARHCQVSIATLRNWIREGKLAYSKTPGRQYRIKINEFKRFLQQQGMADYPGPKIETRILITDDKPAIVDTLTRFLAADPRGFKLEAATDGYEALIKVGAFKPSVLILDVVMPKLDGVEVCRRLKADPETQAIRIIGITGYPESIPTLLEAGADACLTKPLYLEEVRQTLDRLLALIEA